MRWHGGIFRDLGDYAGFLPGVLLALAASLVLSGIVARGLHVARVVAWTLLMSLGLVLAATVTPSREALLFGTTGTAGCDLSRIGPAPLTAYLTLGETSLNVLLYVPLGICAGSLTRRQHRTPILVGVIILPFLIEAIQGVITALDRACQGGDVFDNLAGLVIGLGIGWTGRQLWRRLDVREGGEHAVERSP